MLTLMLGMRKAGCEKAESGAGRDFRYATSKITPDNNPLPTNHPPDSSTVLSILASNTLMEMIAPTKQTLR
jgi:hypothetical protein